MNIRSSSLLQNLAAPSKKDEPPSSPETSPSGAIAGWLLGVVALGAVVVTGVTLAQRPQSVAEDTTSQTAPVSVESDATAP